MRKTIVLLLCIAALLPLGACTPEAPVREAKAVVQVPATEETTDPAHLQAMQAARCVQGPIREYSDFLAGSLMRTMHPIKHLASDFQDTETQLLLVREGVCVLDPQMVGEGLVRRESSISSLTDDSLHLMREVEFEDGSFLYVFSTSKGDGTGGAQAPPSLLVQVYICCKKQIVFI